MKIKKSKIKKIIKEYINERMEKSEINFDDIVGGGSFNPPPSDIERGGGGGGGDDFFLRSLIRNLMGKKEYIAGNKFNPITDADRAIESRFDGIDKVVVLEKDIESSDKKEINLSVTLDFEDISATFFVSCFDPSQDYTDIVDGFTKKVKSNFEMIEVTSLMSDGESKIMSLSSSEILSLGNKLLTK